ncbi:uncharacterized protein LAJ45_11416 [Morchella importuna]|uniref:uncharacterized protein n=1 Tax=Morchella importuna TaxID=1174673 RepID=UPI001E8D98B4|nr:uncharacterized protein LAJ45_11416 [Morchella importuna]KAH8144581.1 hypothetical protein LAJ45_11416 [Morchella importuna]
MFQLRCFSVSAFFRYSKAGKKTTSSSKKVATSAGKKAKTSSIVVEKPSPSSPVGENKKKSANHPLLKPFFATFPNFVRDTEKSPETDFRRLQKAEKWEESSDEYKTARRTFLKTLVDETKSPVHKYFFKRHKDFIGYDSEGSPIYQLDRLRALKNWNKKDTLAAFHTFQQSFKLEFKGKVDLFFAKYPDFPYNPRGNPMAEFRRLGEQKGWDLEDINCFGYGIEKKSTAELRLESKAAHTKFLFSFRDEFETMFGADDEDVGTWQNLCVLLGVDPIPESIFVCRRVST